MKRTLLIAVVAVAVCAASSVLMAQQAPEAKFVRGTFVKLTELKVGDREYLGIAVQPNEGEGPVVLLVPMRQVEGKWVRNEDLSAAVKALKQGQAVTVAYVEEDTRKMIRRLEAHRAEGDQPKDGQPSADGQKPKEAPAVNLETATPDQLRGLLRQMQTRISQMEAEMKALRAENEKLRQRLGGEPAAKEQPKPAADGAAASAVPEALSGFRGLLIGTIKSKEARSFVLEVEKIGKTWEQNKAEHPEAVVGKLVHIVIPPASRLTDQHVQTLAGLKPGDRVTVEAFPDGGRMVVVEQLQKTE